jgi:DNA polymerase III alpha subunit (gram-positive type)
MGRLKFAVHDWETTGLPFHKDARLEQQPRCIEFGGVITDGIRIFDRLEFIINPGVAIEEIITKITGLTNADLEDKPNFKSQVPALKKFFAQADCAVSHNLSFDKSMARYDLQRICLDLEDIAWPKIDVCTVEQTMHAHGRRMRLIDLYELNCGPYVQKHRALDDVMLLHEICIKMGIYDAFNEGEA